ncbi:MAG: hypothetical protein H6627_09815 [Calditrichae bacterium]|nr:hypothetical protein [Calditrichia bacterium]
MKKMLTIAAIVLITGTFALAQDAPKSLDNATQNYMMGLNHHNNGVIESAITNVMLLKLYHPEKDFSDIAEKLDALTIENPDKMIRLKAFIAANYIKHPERFNWIEKGDYEDAVAFFEMYSAKLKEMNYNLQKGSQITATK